MTPPAISAPNPKLFFTVFKSDGWGEELDRKEAEQLLRGSIFNFTLEMLDGSMLYKSPLLAMPPFHSHRPQFQGNVVEF